MSPLATVLLVLCAGLLVVLGLGLRALRQGGAREQRAHELRSALERAGSEAEGRRALLRHLGEILPTAGLLLLGRPPGEGKLEPYFGDRVAGTPLAGLPIGRPGRDSCLADRLTAVQGRASGEPPGACTVCGSLSGSIRCSPLQVAGARLGSVLVTDARPIGDGQRRELDAALALAGPMLALWRTRTALERGAAVDSLTGLPVRPVAEATLRRLSAQAGRAVSPLGAIVVDLDNFSQLNQAHGRANGDRVLAATATTLQVGVRASDFVGRHGGEEFLVLLPDTDRRGAADLAERLRRGIEDLVLPEVGQVTASFGVAAVPDDAADAHGLLRCAERAVRVAKEAGRNRVASASGGRGGI